MGRNNRKRPDSEADAAIRRTANMKVQPEDRHVAVWSNVVTKKLMEGGDEARREFIRRLMPLRIQTLAEVPDMYEPDHPMREIIAAYDPETEQIDWESLGDAILERMDEFEDGLENGH